MQESLKKILVKEKRNNKMHKIKLFNAEKALKRGNPKNKCGEDQRARLCMKAGVTH